jgi:hypothetical protein
VLYHSVENVSELNRIHIYAQYVNWSAGIRYPHSWAWPVIGSFLLGFTYCDGRETDNERNIIFRCSFIGYFFLGFILWQQGKCVYVWLWYKRERTSKHSAIWLIIGSYAPSYKSDSLVFRCSFYSFFRNILCEKKLIWTYMFVYQNVTK